MKIDAPESEEVAELRSGYVALVGRPNVGKSTILNRLLGEKIAATTHKPQTTRRNILGLLNPPGAQILILDTPGHHQAKGALNRYMVAQAEQAIADADIVAYVQKARADDVVTSGNERLLHAIRESKKPTVALLNKVDLVKEKKGLLLQIRGLTELLGDQLQCTIPVCAIRGEGLDAVVEALVEALPSGPRYYDPGQLTSESERDIAAEMVREKVMLATHQELPYAAAVVVDEFEDERPTIVRIHATVHVERESQKGIVIGRGGERIKEIGSRARKDVERFLGSKVFLALEVRVSTDWSSDTRAMARLGYAP